MSKKITKVVVTGNSDHPSKDHTSRFPLDRLLRDNGFALKGRKGREEPVWVRDREEFRQSKALVLIDKQKVQDAQYLEELQQSEECAGS